MNYALFPIMCVQVPTTWWWEGKTISPASADWWPVRLTKLVESLPQSAGVGSILQSVTSPQSAGEATTRPVVSAPQSAGEARTRPVAFSPPRSAAEDCARFVQLGGWPPLRRTVTRGIQGDGHNRAEHHEGRGRFSDPTGRFERLTS